MRYFYAQILYDQFFNLAWIGLQTANIDSVEDMVRLHYFQVYLYIMYILRFRKCGKKIAQDRL